jgi:hypothetical protein
MSRLLFKQSSQGLLALDTCEAMEIYSLGPGIWLTKPLGYLEFLRLNMYAKLGRWYVLR